MSDYFLSEINLDGFQVVKGQYFQKQAEPILTLWPTAMAFGQGAFQAFHNCECIQVFLNSLNKSILICPASSNAQDAVAWRHTKAEPKYSKVDCPQLARKLFEQWGFRKECHYKTVGRLVQVDQKLMILFDFNNPEIFEGARRVLNDG